MSRSARSVSFGVLQLQNNVELSEAQIQDLLHLRKLFCGKIGQLGRARRNLLSQLPSESIGISHASDKLDQVTSLAEQLKANGSEEYRTYMQFASTFYRGVSVHSYALCLSLRVLHNVNVLRQICWLCCRGLLTSCQVFKGTVFSLLRCICEHSVTLLPKTQHMGHFAALVLCCVSDFVVYKIVINMEHVVHAVNIVCTVHCRSCQQGNMPLELYILIPSYQRSIVCWSCLHPRGMSHQQRR